MTTWHDSAAVRLAVGQAAEARFARQVRCSCGGRFNFIGAQYPGCPDFTCEYCGQLVDVKFSPQAEATGNLAVSAIPWSKYPDDLLLATVYRGRWVGAFKRDLRPRDPQARAATHGDGARYRGTRFHLIPLAGFVALVELGFTVIGEQP